MWQRRSACCSRHDPRRPQRRKRGSQSMTKAGSRSEGDPHQLNHVLPALVSWKASPTTRMSWPSTPPALTAAIKYTWYSAFAAMDEAASSESGSGASSALSDCPPPPHSRPTRRTPGSSLGEVGAGCGLGARFPGQASARASSAWNPGATRAARWRGRRGNQARRRLRRRCKDISGPEANLRTSRNLMKSACARAREEASCVRRAVRRVGSTRP